MNVASNTLETKQYFGFFYAVQNVLTQWGPAEPDHYTVMVSWVKFLFHCGLILNPAFPKQSTDIWKLLQFCE